MYVGPAGVLNSSLLFGQKNHTERSADRNGERSGTAPSRQVVDDHLAFRTGMGQGEYGRFTGPKVSGLNEGRYVGGLYSLYPLRLR